MRLQSLEFKSSQIFTLVGTHQSTLQSICLQEREVSLVRSSHKSALRSKCRHLRNFWDFPHRASRRANRQIFATISSLPNLLCKMTAELTFEKCVLCASCATSLSQQTAALDCNRMQHAATDCNRLQQTATDCNRLQQTAPDCNRLQQTATDCNEPDLCGECCSRILVSFWLDFL